MWSGSDRIIYLPPAEVDPEFELPAVLGINRTWRPLSVARIAFGCKIEGRVEGVEEEEDDTVTLLTSLKILVLLAPDEEEFLVETVVVAKGT